MKKKNKVQQWCALFAKIEIPKSLIIAVLQNETDSAELIMRKYLQKDWLPSQSTKLSDLYELMPKIREHLSEWSLDEKTLLTLCHHKNTTELLKLYIIYNGSLPEVIFNELIEHPRLHELLKLYIRWQGEIKENALEKLRLLPNGSSFFESDNDHDENC